MTRAHSADALNRAIVEAKFAREALLDLPKDASDSVRAEALRRFRETQAAHAAAFHRVHIERQLRAVAA